MPCPYKPGTEKFSLSRCNLCRSTTRIGYFTRKWLCDRGEALRVPLEYKRLHDGCYNFDCPHFPWNIKRTVKDILTREEVNVEGVPPLGPDDCDDNQSRTCKKFHKPISTKVGLFGGKLRRDGKIPICEVCMISYAYSKRLERLMSDATLSK